MNRHVSREDIRMANKHVRRCSMSLVIRGMQIQTVVRYPLRPCGWLLSRYRKVTDVGKDVEKREPLCAMRGNVKWPGCCGKVWRFLKKLKLELPYDPAIPLVGMYPSKMKAGSRRGICTPMVIAALFTRAKR